MDDHTSNTPQKTCTKCKQTFPATRKYFNKNCQAKDGLHPNCKPCRREYREANKDHIYQQKKNWRENNPEKEKSRVQKWIKENRDYYLETKRQYYEENKVEILAKQKQDYYENHQASLEYGRAAYHRNKSKIHVRVSKRYATNLVFQEAVKARVKQWVKDNPEKVRAQHSVRKQRKRIAPGHFTADDILLLYRSQKGMCWWCGKALNKKYHVDHRVPLAKGGTNWPENLCISCPKCNLSKHDKLPSEWNGRLL